MSGFDFGVAAGPGSPREIAPQVTWLPHFVATAPLRDAIDRIAAAAPFRHLVVPRGGRMSVAMTNCGTWGWHSDRRGYRYVDVDPETGRPWPAIPPAFLDLAARAAAAGGFPGYVPDACLVNRYAIGAQMGAHRDYDELDMSQPIVSVSIGLPATFLWYGARRTDPPVSVLLEDGDVLVWGGSARAGYHAVRKLKAPRGMAPVTGDAPLRYNLTFRRAR
ncbi:MAG: alpha-ketoglutarate-dependent dioxygenase AlkB [Steroidobacteraceae bacterium]|nr:alpha-ketoglutarate-dependent dioxygenase AlkB [Steroidobacteraceae bacterium]